MLRKIPSHFPSKYLWWRQYNNNKTKSVIDSLTSRRLIFYKTVYINKFSHQIFTLSLNECTCRYPLFQNKLKFKRIVKVSIFNKIAQVFKKIRCQWHFYKFRSDQLTLLSISINLVTVFTHLFAIFLYLRSWDICYLHIQSLIVNIVL